MLSHLTLLLTSPRAAGVHHTSRLWLNAGMENSFKTIALIGKYNSPEIAEPLLKLADFLAKRGVTVLIDKLTGAHIKN
jgi:hypothetical protein